MEAVGRWNGGGCLSEKVQTPADSQHWIKENEKTRGFIVVNKSDLNRWKAQFKKQPNEQTNLESLQCDWPLS